MKFADLTGEQRKTVRRNLRRTILAVSFAQGYDVVSGPDRMLRPRGTVEWRGEDGALPAWNRLNMLNLARQGARNGDSMRALMRQMELNAVGHVGGKATFAFPAAFKAAAEDLRGRFADWARRAEFGDDLCLSKLLRLVVDTKFLGGDVVLLFDDGLVEDSGKVLAFEPDEIADVPREWLREKFPAGYVQRQGRIYNPNGRFVGVTVSHRYRGATTFRRDPDGVLFLVKDDARDVQDWVMLRDVWRFNQGRGVAPVAAPLDSLLDLESVTKFEVQAAMKNAQTVGQIISTNRAGSDADEIPEELDRELLKPDEAAAAEAVADAADPSANPDGEDGEDTFELENIRGTGAIFDQLPDGLKMELLDTKRPNPNVEGFVKWLSGRAGAAIGLAKCYATMEAAASYTAFRGEQVMTWPTFEDCQKDLERDVCDWLVRRWAAWAAKRGEIDLAALPPNWWRCVHWSWPVMREVDMKATAEAKRLMLENGLVTLAELHPGDPDGYMEELGKDVERYHRIGLVHPMEKSVSGGTLSPSGGAADSPATESAEGNEKENEGNEE